MTCGSAPFGDNVRVKASTAFFLLLRLADSLFRLCFADFNMRTFALLTIIYSVSGFNLVPQPTGAKAICRTSAVKPALFASDFAALGGSPKTDMCGCGGEGCPMCGGGPSFEANSESCGCGGLGCEMCGAGPSFEMAFESANMCGCGGEGCPMCFSPKSPPLLEFSA